MLTCVKSCSMLALTLAKSIFHYLERGLQALEPRNKRVATLIFLSASRSICLSSHSSIYTSTIQFSTPSIRPLLSSSPPSPFSTPTLKHCGRSSLSSLEQHF